MVCYGLWACCFLAFVASFDCCIGLGDLVGFGGCYCCVCLDWFGLWVGVAWVFGGCVIVVVARAGGVVCGVACVCGVGY